MSKIESDFHNVEQFIASYTSIQRRLYTFIISFVPDSAQAEDLVRGASVGGNDHMALPGFTVAYVVPEPSALSLLGAATGGLTVMRRRRGR